MPNKHSHHLKVLLLLLAALLNPALGHAESNPASPTVIPLGIPAVSSAKPAGLDQVCGIRLFTSVERQRPMGQGIQLVNLATAKVTTLVTEGSGWNFQDEILTGAVCPAGTVLFTTKDRYTEQESVWKVINGNPTPLLRRGDSFGGYQYIENAQLVGNAKWATILGRFSTPQGNRYLAFTLDGQLVADYGNNQVYSSCVTDQFLVTVAQYAYPFGKFNIITRARGGLLQSLGAVENLGNDGSIDTSLLNLTHSIGCNSDTAGFMIRTGKIAIARVIHDADIASAIVFSGDKAGNYPVSDIWGLSIADGNVSFAMRASTPEVPGQVAIFRIYGGKATPIAIEGVDFNRGTGSRIEPLAVGKRLIFFQVPTGLGYEVKQ